MPSGPSTAARTPFVLLVVLLLGSGLITLLLLNSALNEGSFRLSELRKRTTELTDDQQALQRDVDSASEPDALARRARELGMVPGGSPAFLDPDGTVRGVPSAAGAAPVTAPPPKPEAPEPPPVASPTPSGPSPSPTATATATPAATGPSTPAAKPGASASGTATPKPGTSAKPRTPAVQPSTTPGR
ncbi:cell division protein FtsL [Streptomyces sp. NBC_00338]|uniref:cell division protein FtsL n=1 Tax=Streptomyces sp. NBC_00338 TaxID=2975715 RepID=UPI00225492C4|nr:cell division protein FtsL [Streptomyces sp. NBC_00338]MCX5139696.1 cell division protein FtsL [Streptomyces sp. NBC_00338]